MRKTMCAALVTCAWLGACGEEPRPSPEKRCEVEGHRTFAAGDLGSTDYELSLAEVTGLVSGQNITVQLPGFADGKTMILKMRFSDATNLLDEITRASLDSFDVVDATDIPAGSMNVSGLDKYECSLGAGKICAQVGVDHDGDGLISDDDSEVYNAKGGKVVFETIDGLSRSIKFQWTIDLGSDIFASDSGPGVVRGCLDASYMSAGSATWSIE